MDPLYLDSDVMLSLSPRPVARSRRFDWTRAAERSAGLRAKASPDSRLLILCRGQIIQRGYNHVPGDAHAVGVRRVTTSMLLTRMYKIPVVAQNICVVNDVRGDPASLTGQSNKPLKVIVRMFSARGVSASEIVENALKQTAQHDDGS